MVTESAARAADVNKDAALMVARAARRMKMLRLMGVDPFERIVRSAWPGMRGQKGKPSASPRACSRTSTGKDRGPASRQRKPRENRSGERFYRASQTRPSQIA